MSSDTLLDKRSWLSGLMVGVTEGGVQDGVGQQQGSSSVHAFRTCLTLSKALAFPYIYTYKHT